MVNSHIRKIVNVKAKTAMKAGIHSLFHYKKVLDRV